ncbi:MAG TPA: hypothetical protein PLD88_13800 [Candidatus Berkiella sp.]|nr:hypothetical protein [Candidatus Berkiella sp.]
MSKENNDTYSIKLEIKSSDDRCYTSETLSFNVEDTQFILSELRLSIECLTKDKTLTIEECHLPQGFVKKIINSIEKNSEATFVVFPKDVLNSQEKRRLEKILKPRQEQVKQKRLVEKAQQARHTKNLEQARNDHASSRNRYLMVGYSSYFFIISNCFCMCCWDGYWFYCFTIESVRNTRLTKHNESHRNNGYNRCAHSINGITQFFS